MQLNYRATSARTARSPRRISRKQPNNGGWNPHAFFPTPHPVVELMVQISINGEEENANGGDFRLRTVMALRVGTGRMLLHVSNYSYCLYGNDIDSDCSPLERETGPIGYRNLSRRKDRYAFDMDIAETT